MNKTFSVFEAKTHLSELLRLVKSGHEITITERSVPIATVFPYQESDSNLADRLKKLESQGVLERKKPKPLSNLDSIAQSGVLERFLRDRE